MKYRLGMVLLYVLVLNLVIWALLFSFGNKNINLFSVFTLIIATIVPFLGYSRKTDEQAKLDKAEGDKFISKLLFYNDTDLSTKKAKALIASILVGNVVFAVLNSYVVMQKIDTQGDPGVSNVVEIVKALNITSIIITQFGGFCIQSILIYMLAIVMGTNKRLNTYLKIVGFSYIGFLLLTICSIFVNLLFVPENVTLAQFKTTFEGSLLHGWLGKSGEYLVLVLIGLGIYNSDKFSFPKSFMLTAIPSILLLIMKDLFSSLL